MTQENKAILVARFKSFLWRLAGMAGATGLGFLADNLGLFGFDPAIVGILGLVIGEITKMLNTKVEAKK